MKLRERLALRWKRRRVRLAWLLALSLIALAAAVALAVRLGVAPLNSLPREPVEEAIALVLFSAAFAVGVRALHRYDRTRRRARAVHIRLQHVERRLASLAPLPDDGDAGGRPVA